MSEFNFTSLKRLLDTFKKMIFKDLNVAQIAKVTRVYDGLYTCYLYSTKTYIEANIVEGLNIAAEDDVLVLFTDQNFKQWKKSNDTIDMDNSLHHKNNAVIIAKVQR